MKIDAELFDLCREFIKENKIRSSEDVENYSEETQQLLEQICDLIGYYDHDDEIDQEELDFDD